MALFPWKDHLGNKIINQNNNDIIFRLTSAQINMTLDIDAPLTVIRPMGDVDINISFLVDATIAIRIFMASRVLMFFLVNANAQEIIYNWLTIMFRYEGDRI